MLKLYNDLTDKKENFKVQDQVVKMYSCGPTVYDYAHIGNLRTFSMDDLLVRYLKYKGYKVIHVRNLTDIEDKIIKALNNNPDKTLKEYTDYYINAFFDDCKKMKITNSSYYPRATEYVDKIVDFIYDLIRKGFAYKSDDGSVYFSISKFKDYGKLAKLDKRDLKKNASGVIQDEYSKEELNDFVLWKAYTPKDGKVFWESKLGKGRPGWHIECSVMSTSLLGNTLDIHSGGEDLLFPHHENEIAQSEAHSGEQFARFWVHCKHLLVNNQKMSKSLGNFYTLRDLEKQGYNPLALKFLYLSSSYMNQLNFTFESLNAMQKNLNDINLLIAKLTNYFSENKFDENQEKELEKKVEELTKNIRAALDDNLNSPLALTHVYEFVSYANSLLSQGLIDKKIASEIVDVFEDLDSIFGLFTVPEKINEDLESKLWERYNARKIKDFATSDRLRKEFDTLGIVVGDIPNGFTVIRKS